MPDPIFADPRLAALYDTFDGDRADLAAYRAIVEELGAGLVLDVGCGTGSLALLLARSGHPVVAVDPAEASLDIARGKDREGLVRWIHGDAGVVRGLGADLATMTGNVAQVFRTDDDWAQALRDIGAALRPYGHLVFETRRPEFRAWEEWAAETRPISRDVPGVGPVERYFEVTDVSLPLVTFRYTYRFRSDGTVVTSESTLRFRGRDEMAESLTRNGYRVLEVREAPDRPGRELVFLTRWRGRFGR